ncbi:hypothetical protein [Oceanicoccus sp. KOV_DT_Chl]|uniref:hypothetical protein n=1 Tax=Oceanicoccus sp. KOV_DT_Chl TaxID=1904639 RepID=UPI000C7AC9A3|nr:hypothetical protein [Oceanicoccus sp. KOV_DT_Chl]
MNKTVGLKKERLIFGVFLLIFIVLLELVLHYLQLPAWPAFMVMIFFFEAHMDKSRAQQLIVGGVTGVACYVLTKQFVELTGPLLGVWMARLMFICLVVYAIVALGEILPLVFNNYAFMFFLVSGLAANAAGVTPAPLTWMLVTLVGGAVVIGGILAIGQLMARLATPQN